MVKRGKVAKQNRQESALKRLEKHLENHEKKHAKDIKDGIFKERNETFPDHDRKQRAEYDAIKKGLCKD